MKKNLKILFLFTLIFLGSYSFGTGLTTNSKIFFRDYVNFINAEGKLKILSTTYTNGRVLEFFNLPKNAVADDEIKEFIRLLENNKIDASQIKAIARGENETIRRDLFRNVIKNEPAKGVGLIDDVLDAAKSFDDNALDITDVGLANWKGNVSKVLVKL